MKLLAEKRAIVTGGTRGIGKGIAAAFIEQGASVAVFGTSESRGAEALKELQARAFEGQKIAFYKVDVADTKQVEATIQQVCNDFGGVDILVNNAGITRDGLLMRLSEDDWEEVINTNLKSVYNTCRSVIRPMMKARQGKIINITSVVGLMGNPGQTNYAASKSGMIGFTKSLAKEMGARNVCVNCIAPGFIATDMTEALNEKQREAILSQIPMQKLGRPEDIANAALFLASPLADYVTGQVLTVDGGMVMA
ncbi:MAG: 3-oxoacyl-ACP reductase FabG [Chlamydiales bacterium]|nr:3-oxoacyl-ACP reductase FabG [Chlamydiales bacterium]